MIGLSLWKIGISQWDVFAKDFVCWDGAGIGGGGEEKAKIG
jgi:hypothetical protein